MPSAEPPTGGVTCGDLLKMDDAQLAQLLRKLCLPDGRYSLEVDIMTVMSLIEELDLGSDLIQAKGPIVQDSTASGTPTSVEDCRTRLHESSLEDLVMPERPLDADLFKVRTSASHALKHQVKARRDLIENGGRPMFLLETVQKIYEGQDWNAGPLGSNDRVAETGPAAGGLDPRYMYVKQLQRWQDFRKWQRDNRGLEVEDGGFDGYLQRARTWARRRNDLGLLNEVNAKGSPRLHHDYKIDHEFRKWQMKYCRESGCTNLREYSEAMATRLARHGFIQAFQLDQDPTKQDKLSTWIEYLNFEYWWLDKYMNDVRRIEPASATWYKQLGDDGLLRRGDTPELLRRPAAFEQAGEEAKQADEAAERAEAKVARIQALYHGGEHTVSEAERAEVLWAVKAQRDHAQKVARSAWERTHGLHEFYKDNCPYVDAMLNAEHLRGLVLPWALCQVPLVKAEMEYSKVK